MIIIGNLRTYNFEGIHIPRIYINDVNQVRSALELLHKKGSLTNKEMTEETARVRSEDIREIYYLLWKLGFGIDVTKKGREIAFVANDKLQSIIELNNINLKSLVLERLKFYNPFIAVLDSLTSYGDKRFTQEDITKDFHGGRSDGGRIDNTHPLLRWANDKDWGLVINGKVTETCVNYIKDSTEHHVFYVHHTVDLEASMVKNVLTHIFSKSFREGKKYVLIDNIEQIILEFLPIDVREIKPTIKELVKFGLPLVEDGNKVKITNIIYHDITPQLYVKFGLNILDEIGEIEIKKEREEEFDANKYLEEFREITTLIIHDEHLDLRNYPENSKKIDYSEFLHINRLLPKLNVNTIILPPNWKPLKVLRISGILLAFVRLGGSLIIFHAPMGRIGSNRNLFNWLPHDLSRISFVYASNNNYRGYFTFPFSEKFTYCDKLYSENFGSNDRRYSILIAKYNLGKIVFTGYEPSKTFFEKNSRFHITTVKIDEKTIEWNFRFVPSLNKFKGIYKEQQLYPILQGLLHDNFGFQFEPDITGKPGQTDIFITKPFFCACEVTPPNNNVTGFTKVAEVSGHRNTLVYKDKKTGNKKFGKNKVGACVFGNSFTIEAGEDKAGAIDMANAENVSLISYRDVYELMCLNAHHKLSTEDLQKIFFNDDNKSEAAEKIYEFIKKLMKKEG